MSLTTIRLTPIGLIRTPHKTQRGTPIQPFAARDVAGTVEIFPEFRRGLADLPGFTRIWLLFWCHRSKPYSLKVIPYRDTVARGLFATRAPSRPNSIGLSPVRLVSVNEEVGKLEVLDVDMLDGTPLLDIKPYVPQFDSYCEAKAGWLDQVRTGRDRADDRFSDHKG